MTQQSEEIRPKDDDTPDDEATVQDVEVPSAPAEEEAVPEVDWKDQYIRLAADFDNFRKRTRAEQEEARGRERDRVLSEWLDVVDSIERALSGLEGQEGPWVEGLQVLSRQVKHVLGRLEVSAMETDGATFDPHQHEAIAAVPVPGEPDGKILQTERRGYVYRNGRVLRAARVIVARSGG